MDRSPLADLLSMPVEQARAELDRALAIVRPARRLADLTDLDAVREDIDKALCYADNDCSTEE